MTRKKIFKGSAVALAAGLMLTACNGGASEDPTADAEAQDLLIYTARAEPISDYVVSEFEAKYPEYKGKVEVLNMGAGDIPDRVRAESSNPQASLWWGGTQQNLSVGVKDDLLEAWPDAPFASDVPAEYKQADGLWYGEYQLPQVIIYNSEALTAQTAPQDFDDLISEEWKDKIVIRDVPPSGGMRSIFDAMILTASPDGSNPEAGYDYLRKLDANTVTYAADPANLYLQLGRQAGIVSLWNMQDTLIQINQEQMPFGFVVPQGGTPVIIDGLGIIKGAPNSQGAKLFAEFVYDQDIRATLAEEYYQIPVTEIANKPAWLDGLTITPLDVDWGIAAEHEAEWIQYWSDNIKNKN